jgi:hypothetical protein
MAKTDLVKTDFPVIASPGSRPMPWAKHEKYCRLRAAMHPRAQAYREAGWNNRNDDSAYADACRLERRPGVKARIEYLSRQEEELIPEKRRRLEEALWSMHDADIGDCFETVEVAKIGRDGKPEIDEDGKALTVRKQRPKLLSDLPADVRKTIERVQADAKGNYVPQLYSRPHVNAELRKLLNIGGQRAPEQSDVSRLSDAELIRQLSDQARELGVEIDLNYSFAQPVPTAASTAETAEATETEAGPVIDAEAVSAVEPSSGANEAGARDAQTAREFAIGMTPAIPLRRQGPAEGARKLNRAGRGKR